MSRRRRERVYELLERPSRADRLSTAIEMGLVLLIVANVAAVALETVREIDARWHDAFRVFDAISVAVFTVEYALRLWASPEREPKRPAGAARLRYAVTPIALVDLAAILPFYLSLVFPIDLAALRVLRLLRVYKLTRHSPALSILTAVIREERSALGAAFSILAILLVFAATGAYYVEHRAQPEAFGSIPAAMWWALVTLTTVGYGDVVPVTVAGRLFGGFITVLGLGMAALPAGILASGLADHLRRRRENLRDRFRLALEDDRIDLAEGRKIERLRRELGISREIARTTYDENPPAATRDGAPDLPEMRPHAVGRGRPGVRRGAGGPQGVGAFAATASRARSSSRVRAASGSPPARSASIRASSAAARASSGLNSAIAKRAKERCPAVSRATTRMPPWRSSSAMKSSSGSTDCAGPSSAWT